MAKLDGYEYVVSEFAESRGVDRNAVTQYIRRHPELFSGHVVVEAMKTYFDDAAMEILDKKYPSLSPVVIDELEIQKQLSLEQAKVEKLQAEIIALKDMLGEKQLALTKQESEMKLLEDRTGRVQEENDNLKEKVSEQTESIRQQAADLATAKTSLEYTEKELEAERQRLEEEKRRTAEVEEELARMKSAGWWKRLRRKW